MPRLTMFVSLFIAAVLNISLHAADTQPKIESFSKMPLAFTKNMGQWDDRVLFRANSGGATMWFTKDGITYQFTRRIDTGNLDRRRGTLHVSAGTSSLPSDESVAQPPSAVESLDSRLRGNDMERDSIDQLILTAKFIGANPNPEVLAEGQLEYKCNYFLGNDPSKWHTDVPNYEAITLKNIYPGIDLKYSGDDNGQAAYEFIAAPGADITQIKVAYDGAESTSLDSDGKLILKTKWGDMTAGMISPVYSPRPLGEGSGVRAVLSGNATCAWMMPPSTTSSSDLARGDARQALAENSGTLTLAYSTYLGGSGDDNYFGGGGIAVDDSGNAYQTGFTLSSNFPTQNPLQGTFGGGAVYGDAFVTKVSNTGNSLIYSTYLGGGSDDYGYRIAVDSSGSAYVTGYTFSSNFPTLNPYQTYQGATDLSDVFVSKLSSSGNSLIYSTYLGGGGEDEGTSIAVDRSGNAYVTGFTFSSNFPTQNPYQSTFQGGDDVFVIKLSSTGNTLIYSTYLGGGRYDWGMGIAVDGSGYAYVTGRTISPNFPTENPYQTYQGNTDVFVTKLSGSGTNLIYSTYLGGGGYERGLCIAVDGGGSAYVTGTTQSLDFPTQNPYQIYQGSEDVFVTKLSSSGNSLIYSTYLGGENSDEGIGIAVDRSGNAYVTGMAYSSDFPTLNPYQPTNQSGDDVFVTKLSSTGNNLIYSTYLGGAGDDYGSGIAVDDLGNAYVTGYTSSTDFPTLNPYQPDQDGWDTFVSKLTWTPDYPCGDVNTDEKIDLLDAVFLINYIFVGGPAPQTLSLADVNCSGSINIADVVLLINYIFRSGPAPCAGCE